MLVHVVADYGAGDLAFAEVQQRLLRHLPGAAVVPVPVPPFATLAAGFCAAQLALGEGPADRVVFHNVAPRQDDEDPRAENEGEALVAARLDDGTLVVGPHAGHAFSFLRGEVDELRRVDVPAAGSQFRSRDVFPAAVARLAAGDDGLLAEAVPWDEVPEVPASALAYVDGYGNLKTTLVDLPAGEGERVVVRIGDVAAPATAGEGTFEVPEGQLALAPGSSGWPTRAGGERRFLELLLRGGSAADRFGGPAPGARIEVEPQPG